MPKLYELTKVYNELWEQIEDIDLDKLEEMLQMVEESIEEKAENTAKLIKSIDSDVNSLKEEEKRLASRRKVLENRQQRIKQYLEIQLQFAGIEKVKGKVFTIAMQNNPPSVDIFNEDSIPEQFISYEKHISKSDILQALKQGEEIAGAIIKQTKSLRIR